MAILDMGALALAEVLRRNRGRALDNRIHCRAAMDWLSAAQDAWPEGGVAARYKVWSGRWDASYPETTGYIIPTMLDYFSYTGDEEYRHRALRMADWEIAVQLESGAVRSGTVLTIPNRPAVFNTGQVIQGLARVYTETGDDRYLRAAERGAKWLVSSQDDDGAWRKDLSSMTTSHVQTYNTRTAWALLQLSEVASKGVYRECAMRNVDWALTQQIDNGWFQNNIFHPDEVPLVHTIGYAVEGILECGVQLGNTTYMSAAVKAADALLGVQQADGALYGRYDSGWKHTVTWSCLTGNAQMSVVWARLYELTREQKYLNAVKSMNRFLKNTQNLHSRCKGIRGGIAGSQPIWGGYARFSYLNWATKFFVDALLKQDKIEQAEGGVN